jgi:hypothetical protein
VLQRWNLLTGELELTVALPDGASVSSMAMGYASGGPLLVASERDAYFVQPSTLARLDLSLPNNRHILYVGDREGVNLRASGDGTVFSTWRKSGSPTGLQTFTLLGNRVESRYEHNTVGYIVPGFNGQQIYTRAASILLNCVLPTKSRCADLTYCRPTARLTFWA